MLRGLLQKNPTKRLSFDAFFSHPFLSGRALPPTRSPGLLHPVPINDYDDYDESAIDDDYVVVGVDDSAPPPRESAHDLDAPIDRVMGDVVSSLMDAPGPAGVLLFWLLIHVFISRIV